MTEKDSNQAEHELISTALEVERLETHLFRSRSLWLPARGRGVFGGQVISQALVSATNCVDPAFAVHSLHSYFLSSASPATPIVYLVERLRQGRSYVACSVKAVQNGRIIFMMMCSFQKPEPWHPTYQWPMPNVPSPQECVLEEVVYEGLASNQDIHPRAREYFKEFTQERARSPIAVMVAKEFDQTTDGKLRFAYWMKARSIPEYEPHFQKCILSYLSDFYLLGVGRKTLGLKRFTKGPQGIGMTSTIDHTIRFYSNDFDCGDWLLYEMDCSRAGSGRGLIHGRLFTATGTLIAVVSQEGVMRAAIRAPETQPELNAKL